MKIAHITDIHLDWRTGEEAEVAEAALVDLPPDVPLVLTGDIALCSTLGEALLAFASGCGGRRIYFVLGNHDAWQGSIAKSRQAAAILARKHAQLVYVPAAGILELTPKTALVGVDGWYDGRAGKGNGSSVHLNDWLLVEELRGLHRERRLEVLQRRAQEDALRARERLTAALQRYEHVVFATHVPPFPQASVHDGRQSDPDYLPWFCNVTLGFALSDAAATFPDRAITVLCGHSHGAGDVAIAPNLRVITGAAVYGKPAIAGVHDFP